MEKTQHVSGDEHSTPEEAEMPMETQLIQKTFQKSKSNRATPNACCTHQRLIDNILTRGGKRTGKVRCLECGTIFDDPYQGSK
ncbi:MAG: hypothetical protein OEY77_11890 [Nitrospira sp.]|nr:hypothetical protein [Nitrospira sp.]